MFSAAAVSSKVDPLTVGVLTVVQGQSAYDSVRRGHRAQSYGGITQSPAPYTGLSGADITVYEFAATQGTPSQILFTTRKPYQQGSTYAGVTQEWRRLIFNGQVFPYEDFASRTATAVDQFGYLYSTIEWAGMPYSASSPYPTIQFIVE